jgi:hypothetical protein
VASEDTTLDALARGMSKPAGDRHSFVIERLLSTVFEVQDLNFHANSCVLLPVPLSPTANGVPAVGGLVTVAGALTNAPGGQQLIVTGHAAGTGAPEGDFTLSTLRAQNVELYVKGDRSGWAAACDVHQGLDLRHLLIWASYAHGYACDPSGAGVNDRNAVPRALSRFREAYNAELGKSLELTGPMRTPDWEAFYDLYDKSLAQLLGCEPSALAGKRAAVTFRDPPSLGCGGNWPAPTPELRSQSGQRVDLMFIEEGNLPDLMKEQPPGASLYGTRSPLKRTYQPLQSGLRPLKLILLDALRQPLAGKAYKLVLTKEYSFEGTTGGDGDLEQQIPGYCPFGDLTVFLDDAKTQTLAWRLLIGQLPPVDRDAGLQARLNLLGVYSGHPGVGDDSGLAGGVSSYQFGRDRLEPTGAVDDDTRSSAEDEYSGLG